MTLDVQSLFDVFDDAISLKTKQTERMNRAWGALQGYLVEALGVEERAIFLQGSYANGTAIEPVDGGEYDIDVVCVCAQPDESSAAALDSMTAVLAGSSNYESRLAGPKECCVRLEYAEDDVGKFHVDVVPTRPSVEAPLDAPRRDEPWHATAPAEYTAWCHDQGPLFVRTVKAAKRWRDEHQSVRGAIKSIVLQVLLAESMPQNITADGPRLAATLKNLQQHLLQFDQPPKVVNPVLASEDLAERWTQESYKEFRAELDEAVELSARAAAAPDEVEAVDAWRELLGDDFPASLPAAFGIRLGDDAHARPASSQGWTLRRDPRYHVEIRATEQRGKRTKTAHRYPSDGPLLFAGKKLRFRAIVAGPRDAEIWWQVANTGAHARERNGLRGQYFKGKLLSGKASPDESENWEDTAYTGSHWIRAVLVRSGEVVAESDRFLVNIYSRSRRFGL